METTSENLQAALLSLAEVTAELKCAIKDYSDHSGLPAIERAEQLMSEIPYVPTQTRQKSELEIKTEELEDAYADSQALNKKIFEIKDIITQHFKSQTDMNEIRIKQLEKEIQDLKRRREDEERAERWKQALIKSDECVIDENVLYAILEQLNYFKKFDLDGYMAPNNFNFVQKKSPQRDVDVWKIEYEGSTPAPFNLYLAFYQGGIIGSSFRLVPQHAGDATYPYSIVDRLGQMVIEEKGEQRTHRLPATYTNWYNELKTLQLHLTDPRWLHDGDTITWLREGIRTEWWR